MTIHHFVTTLLIAGSYVTGHWRIGSVIMLVHDTADYWLEVRFLDHVCTFSVILKLSEGI